MKTTLTRLVALTLFGAVSSALGCGSSTPPTTNNTRSDAHDHDHDHDHGEEGPHGGHLIELGKGDYHAELHHDDATHTVTIYLLDKTAKDPVAIADAELTLNLVAGGKPQQFKLAAKPQPGDPEGQASAFAIIDEAAHNAVEADGTTGRLTVTIAGKTYSGKLDHHHHEH
jgi:hypothetical protein